METIHILESIRNINMDLREKNDVAEVTGIIAKDFNQLSTRFETVRFDSMAQLKEELTKKIAEWMDKRFDLLLSTLYRIDIDENKISHLFSAENKEYIPAVLADLIIQRQIIKMNFRRKYREGKL